MAKTEVTQWDTTAANNLDVNSISLAENVMRPPAVNNAFREMMAQLRRMLNSTVFRLFDTTDITKIAAFDLSGITTGTTRNFTLPNASGTLALEETVDRRDRIVNGGKLVSQENAQTSGTTTGRYLSDQNAMYFVSSAGTFTGVNVQTISPAGGYRDRITITTADASLAAGEYLTYTQNLEGSNVRDLKWGTASAVAAVARIGFKGPAGTYAYRLGNSAANRSYVALFTISAGEANTDVVREFAIPGDTSGTWLNADGVIGITRDIVLACGSTFQGAAGWQAGLILGTSAVVTGMGTGSAVFEFFDEGFKADPGGTGVYGAYEAGYVDPVYRSERYYFSTYDSGTVPGTVTNVGVIAIRAPGSSSNILTNIQTIVEMSRVPAVTAWNNVSGAPGSWRNTTTNANATAVASTSATSPSRKLVSMALASSAAGDLITGHATANARLS